MVLFGVTGDLSRKKVMPAIYDLANRGLLPPGFSLTGFARRDWADQDFAADRARLGQGSTPAPSSARRPGSSWPRGSGSCPATSTTTSPSTRCGAPSRSSTRSAAPTATTPSTWPSRRRSSAPSPASSRSTAWPSADGDAWRRVVIEKPFGHDLESARELNTALDDGLPARRRSSGSTTTSARRPSRTSWRCGSPTRCSSRSGTPTTSTTCRSRWPRTAASRAGPATTTASAPPATSSRTTCSS